MKNEPQNTSTVRQRINRAMNWTGSWKGLVLAYLIAVVMYSVFLFFGLSAGEARSDFAASLAVAITRIEYLEQDLKIIDADIVVTNADVRRLLVMYQSPDMELIKNLRDLSTRLQTEGGISLADLGKLDGQVKSVVTEMAELKGALNPTDPTAAITVARLGDKVTELTQSFSGVEQSIDDIKNDLDAKLLRNFEQMDKQVDRIVGMLKWLGLLMIPAIINLIKGLLPSKEADAPVATPPST